MLADSKLLNLYKSKFLFNNIFLLRNISISSANNAKDSYKLVVVGGGSAGLNISSRFVRKLGKNNVAMIEPSDWHCKYLSIIIYLLVKKMLGFSVPTWLDIGCWRSKESRFFP